MEYWLLMLMMIHLLLVWQTQGGCIEEERNALLEIKASHMKSFASENDHFLPTWVDNGSSTPGDDGGSDCCVWERVRCNSTTGHVTELSLYYLRELYPNWGDESKLWALNASLFFHFKELTSLNLSYNFLDKETMQTGLRSLSRFKKLEVLDLSGNYHLDNDILPSLSGLTSLKILDLSNTGLNGNFPIIYEFAALENLEILDLTNCGLTDFCGTFEIQGSETASILRKLKTLNLGSNRFSGSVITSISTLPSLKKLDLSHSLLSGPFPAEGFERLSSLKKLEVLDLSGNGGIYNGILPSLSTLTSLKVLDLRWTGLKGNFPAKELSHLVNLEELDLSQNSFNDTPNIQACKSLSRLKRLKSIDLSDNHSFNNSIISCLSALPSLKILHLSDSFSWGSSFPAQEFLNLSDLEVLILSDNGFNGTLEAFTSFHHLRVLDLRRNEFVGSIPSEIKALSSLEALSFAGNNLNGSLSTGLCELKNLHELDLSGNMLHGSLPQCFGSLSSLKYLDISSNQFTGILEPSLIANLTSLEYIDLSHNIFEGSFSFSSFSNHSKLEAVNFENNSAKFEVETEEPRGWIPMFQLKVLVLPSCNINRLKGRVVPGFLLHQHKLLELDMSHNSLEGQFPKWFVKKNTNLEFLKLKNNSLNGSMVLLSWNANMKWLDMSANHMTGSIPDHIPNFFPSIEYLNLSRNALSGAIPSSIGDLSRLLVLDLSDNELSGKVPKGLLTNISSLRVLKLSKNKLHGDVLSGNLSFTRMYRVYLDSNNFTGAIGINSGEKEFENLQTLDISNNFFTGIIPDWVGNLRGLSEVLMRNNSFEGQFPCGAAEFRFLDISHNSLSGPIPSCLNLQQMEHLHLGSNRFTGTLHDSFQNLTNVLTLDMGNNNLTGRIPRFIGQLSNLRILILRKNNFRGSISKQLCQLRNASLIDLANNFLSGSIPSCLQNITGSTDLAFEQKNMQGFHRGSTYTYASVLVTYTYRYTSFLYKMEWEYADSVIDMFYTRDEVEFTTKSLSLSYKGDILDYMAGLDLSCNKLTGEIPEELGLMAKIHALNLSHNKLTGPIPVKFSNLANIESLDLSSNGLTGKVPSELVQLHCLSTFNVSHNNLSGRLPDRKEQFGTFEKESYEGNPFLCGLPLEKKCTNEAHVTDPSLEEEGAQKWYDVDMTCFYGSSASTLLVFLLGFVALLFVNPHWRRSWLHMVEEYMYKFYYFSYDSVRKPCMILRN